MTRITSAAVAVATVGLGASVANAELIWGATDDGRLVQFDSSAPMDILNGFSIMGLESNENVAGLDFRPSTGELYALGSFSNLYTLDTASGNATLVGSFADTPLNGSVFGFDFNPVVDMIRVVSDANQNLVLDPSDGSATAATDVFYGVGDVNEGGVPNIAGSAYTNSVAGATETQLYGIDVGFDVLATQDNSNGTLMTVGGLGVDVVDLLGFDISGQSGTAYISAQASGQAFSSLWTIDLATGEGSFVGEVGGGAFVGAITVVPSPGALAIAGLAPLALTRRRRG